VESVAGHEECQPDPCGGFVEQDVLCEIHQRMQSRLNGSLIPTPRWRWRIRMAGQQPHPAIEAIAADDITVANGLHGQQIPMFAEATAIGGHQSRDFG
jgi:hypothetical protein